MERADLGLQRLEVLAEECLARLAQLIAFFDRAIEVLRRHHCGAHVSDGADFVLRRRDDARPSGLKAADFNQFRAGAARGFPRL